MNEAIQCNDSLCSRTSCHCRTNNCSQVCFRSTTLSNDYLLYFDEKLRLLDLNTACFKSLKNESLPKSKLVNKDFLYFFPDFKESGALKEIKDLTRHGRIFELNEYQVRNPVNREVYVKFKLFKSKDVVTLIATDISDQKVFSQIAHEQTTQIENLKITLDILLKKFTESKEQIEKNCCYNIEELIFPMLDLLKTTAIDSHQAAVLEIMEANLKTITSPFARSLNIQDFTRREIEIANLIRFGKTTKEISQILHLSSKAVEFHRTNIRKKLDIKNGKDNLRSSLLLMSEQA